MVDGLQYRSLTDPAWGADMIVRARPPKRTRKPRPAKPVPIARIRHFERRWGDKIMEPK